jgi:uncharacterized membrane protein
VVTNSVPADADTASLLGLSPRAAAALAWGGAWITGGLVTWLAPDGASFVRHHARHSLWVTGGVTLIATGLWVLGILMAFLVTPTAFAAVSWMASGAWVFLPLFWAWGLFRALRGQRIRMPGLTAHIESAPAPSPAPAEAQPN